MKYTILGFNQAELIKYGLDITDALLLRYFVDFKDTQKMKSIIINDTAYYWVKYLAVKEEYQILNIKNADSIYRRYKKMVKVGILKHKTVKKEGTFSYYAIGENYSKLISNSDLKTTGTDLKSEGYGFKVGEGTDLKSEGYGFKVGTNNPSTIDPSTINPSTIYKDIISYLNSKTYSKYKLSTKKTKVLIDARLKEGFTLEDFKIVIDKKSKEWINTDMEKYLRPETLFGTKFEGYLNQKDIKNNIYKQTGKELKFNDYEQRSYDYDSLEKKLLGWDEEE